MLTSHIKETQVLDGSLGAGRTKTGGLTVSVISNMLQTW